MTGWLAVFLFVYVVLLAINARQAKRENGSDAHEIVFARSGMRTSLLFLSFAATLFSTFTLMGIPDFFRIHGAATWLFIGVTDVAMGFVVLWFGLRYRKIIEREGVFSVSELLNKRFGSALPVYVYLIGIFVFLAPYVAIQIQGVSQLLTVLSPAGVPAWFWAICMLLLIGVYSWIGGLRAIVYSDVVQGLVLLAVIWLVAHALASSAGGVSALLSQTRNMSPALMTAPGPAGLMTWQFLLASFVSILWMPVTQPQLTARIAATKGPREIPIMALSISFFALIILLPTIVIGFAGAVAYPDLSSGEFLARILVVDQAPVLGALAIVGLIAAAMSTADSQLFALSAEGQAGLRRTEGAISSVGVRILVAFFAIGCFVLSLLTSSELVLLARVSFAGTAIVGPMIVLATFSEGRLSLFSPCLAFVCLLVFALSTLGVLPTTFSGVRVDLALMLITAFIGFAEYRIHPRRRG